MKATVEFCGEIHEVQTGDSIVIGREGDIVIDDNPYLHRHFLSLYVTVDLVWLHNVGSQIGATVSDAEGLTQTWLAPSARLPLVFPSTTVWFTAGPTTYGFDVRVDKAPVMPSRIGLTPEDQTTIGHLGLTPDQRVLVVSLTESVLRHGLGGKGQIPSSAAAAHRLGWTITKFNRKLDNVCEKLSRLGVTGLVGASGSNASSRRSRLVEYAVATRLVTASDLPMLEQDQPPLGVVDDS